MATNDVSTNAGTPTSSIVTPEGEQLAQATAAANNVVSVELPGAGETATVIPDLGTTYRIDAADAKLTQQQGNLMVETAQGTLILQDFFVLGETELPPSLQLGDGQPEMPATIISQIENFDPEAVTPAAGGGAGGGVGGASFTAFQTSAIGDGLDTLDLLGNLDLTFGLPEGLLDPGLTDPAEGTLSVDVVTFGTDVVVDPEAGLETPVEGSFQGGFEDWQPNLDEGDTTVAPMRMIITFVAADNEILEGAQIFPTGDFTGWTFMINGVPQTPAANGAFVVTAADIANITLLPPEHWDGDMPFNVNALISDPDSQDVAVLSVATVAIVDAVADPAIIEVGSSLPFGGDSHDGSSYTNGAAIWSTIDGTPGTTVSIDWVFGDGDGSPWNDAAFIVIDGEYVKLADASGSNTGGTYTFEIPADGSVAVGFAVMNDGDTFADSGLLVGPVTVGGNETAIAWESLGTTSTDPVTGAVTLVSNGATADDIADSLGITGENPSLLSYNEDNASGEEWSNNNPVYGIGFKTETPDQDGSEEITQVTITLSNLQNGIGSPEFAPAQVSALVAESPAADPAHVLWNGMTLYDGAVIQIPAQVYDPENPGTPIETLVNAVVSFGTAEDGSPTVTFTDFSPTDPDSPDLFQVLELDFTGSGEDQGGETPESSVFVTADSPNGNGSGLQIELPQHSDDDFTVGVAVTTEENNLSGEELSEDNNTAVSTISFDVEVKAVADAVDLTGPKGTEFDEDAGVTGAQGAETPVAEGYGQTIPMVLTANLQDQDGSELVRSVVLTRAGGDDAAHFVDGEGNVIETGDVIQIGGLDYTAAVDGRELTLTLSSADADGAAVNFALNGEVGVQLSVDDSSDFSITYDVTTQEVFPDTDSDDGNSANGGPVAHEYETTSTTIDYTVTGKVGQAALGTSWEGETGEEGAWVVSEDDGETDGAKDGGVVVAVAITAQTQDQDLDGEQSESITQITLTHDGQGAFELPDESDGFVMIDGHAATIVSYTATEVVLAFSAAEDVQSIDLSDVRVVVGDDDSTDFDITAVIQTTEYDDDGGQSETTTVTTIQHVVIDGVAETVSGGFTEADGESVTWTYQEDGGDHIGNRDGSWQSADKGVEVVVAFTAGTQDEDAAGEQSEGISRIVLTHDGQGAFEVDGAITETYDGVSWIISEDGQTLTLTFADPADVQSVDLSDFVKVQLGADDSTDFTIDAVVTSVEYDDDGTTVIDSHDTEFSQDVTVEGVAESGNGWFWYDSSYATGETEAGAGIVIQEDDGSDQKVGDGIDVAVRFGSSARDSDADGEKSEGIYQIVLTQDSDGGSFVVDGVETAEGIGTVIIDGYEAAYEISADGQTLTLTFDTPYIQSIAATALGAKVSVHVESDDSNDFSITGQVITVEYDDDTESVTSNADYASASWASDEASQLVIVRPVADIPDVELGGNSEGEPEGTDYGKEDAWIPIHMDAVSNDVDGSEAITSFTVSGFPEGPGALVRYEDDNGDVHVFRYVASKDEWQEKTDDGWQPVADQDFALTLTPAEADTLKVRAPSQSDVDFDLSISVTVTDTDEDADGFTDEATFGPYTLNVEVDSVADGGKKLAASGEGYEDGSIAPTLSAHFSDNDESETHVLFVTVPEGWTVGAELNGWTLVETGTYAGQYMLDVTALGKNVSVSGPTMLPPADSDVDGSVTLSAVTTELNAEGTYNQAGNDVKVVTKTGTLAVDAVADQPAIDAADGVNNEDNAVGVPFGTDPADGSTYTEGAAAWTTIDGIPGTTVAIEWAFTDNDGEFGTYNDAAFIVIDGEYFRLGDSTTGSDSGVYTFDIPADGSATVGFVVINDQDDFADSALNIGTVTVGGTATVVTWNTLGTALVDSVTGAVALTAEGAEAGAIATALGAIDAGPFVDGISRFDIGFSTAATDVDGSEELTQVVVTVSSLQSALLSYPEIPAGDGAVSYVLWNGNELSDGDVIQIPARIFDPANPDTPISTLVDATVTFGEDAAGNTTLTFSDFAATDPGSPDPFQVLELDFGADGAEIGLGIDLPPHSDDDFSVGVSVTAEETNLSGIELTTGNNSATTTTSFDVDIKAVADAPTLGVSNSTVNEDGTAYGVDQQLIAVPAISAAFPDQDGSETHTVALTFSFDAGEGFSAATGEPSDSPEGTFSLRYPDGNGGYTTVAITAGDAVDVPLDQLGNLEIIASGDWYGQIDVEVTGTATETNTDDDVVNGSDIALESASSTQTFTITVDATPDQYDPDGEGDAAIGPEPKIIAEAAVSGGDGLGGDADGTDYTNGDAAPSVTGALNIEFGDDYPATMAVDLSALNTTLTNDGWTSEGRPLVAVSDGSGGALITAGAGGETVMTVTFGGTAPNYSYTLTLLDNVDHPEGTDEDLTLTVPFTATDHDGDSLDSSFAVTITDDGPVANGIDIAGCIVEGGEDPASLIGNVITGVAVTGNHPDLQADEPGADGATVHSFTVGDVTYTFDEAGNLHLGDASGPEVTQPVKTAYGSLEMSPDGTYTYTPDASVDHDQETTLNLGMATMAAFDFTDFDPNATLNTDLSDTSVYNDTVTHTGNGYGVKGASAAEGNTQVPDQINHGPTNDTTEGLVIDFGSEGTSATATVSNLYADEGGEGANEVGHWYAYNAEGELVGDASFEFDSGNKGTVDINPGSAFQYIVFTADPYSDGGQSNNDSSDYFVKAVSFVTTEAAQESITYTLIDGDGDISDPATVTFCVRDGEGPSLVVDPEGAEIVLTVDEADITDTDSDGIAFQAGSDAITGFAFGDTSGIVVNGIDEILTWELSGGNLIGYTIDSTNPEITLSLSGTTPIAAETQGTVTVTATLSEALQHVGDDITINGVKVVATDVDGDTAIGEVEVHVIDDAPTSEMPSIDGNTGLYLADSNTDAVYTVELAGDEAILTKLFDYPAEVGGDIHIAASPDGQLIYGFDANTGGLFVYDAGTGSVTVLDSVTIPGAQTFPKSPQLAIDAAGNLYFASETGDLYLVSAETLAGAGNEAELVGDLGISIAGADLAFGENGDLYVATKSGDGKVYQYTAEDLHDGGTLTPHLVETFPSSTTTGLAIVNGVILTSDASDVILGSGGESYAMVYADGSSHDHLYGDMASSTGLASVREAVVDDEGAQTVTGSFGFDFGNDGPAEQGWVQLHLTVTDPEGTGTFGTYAIDGATGYLVDTTNPATDGNEDNFLTSGGDKIVVSDDGNGNLVGTTENGGEKIFTVSVDQNGDFSITFKGSIDHPDENESEAADPLAFNLSATITDSDGDTHDTATATVLYLDDAPAKGQVLTITNHTGEAGYQNAFGYYIIGENGEPTTGEIIWANASGANQGASFQLEGYTEDQIGFFIIPKGNQLNDIDNGTEVTFAQIDGQWVACVDDGGTTVALQGADDTPTLFSDSSLNPSGFDSERTGDDIAAATPSGFNEKVPGFYADGESRYWADIPTGDHDYDDVQVTVHWSDEADGLAVDEDDLPDGSDTSKEPTSVTGKLVVDYGADDFGGLAFDPTIDGMDSGLEHDGTAILYEPAADGLSLNGVAGGEVIFSVTLNEADHTYTFTLKDSIDHATGGGQNTALVSIAGAISATDGDGDQVFFDLSVNIVDDVPIARNDAKSVTEGESVDGNVLANDTDGADAEGYVSGVAGGTDAGIDATHGQGWTVAGSYGTLTIYADGTYSYAAGSDLNNAEGVNDVFTYTLKDDDGDTSKATLTITVDDGDDPSLVEDPEGAEIALTVNEAEITDSDSDGIAFQAGSDAITGFAFGDTSGIIVDGIDETLNWSVLANGNLIGYTTNINDPEITLSLSGATSVAAEAQGTVTVTATLSEALKHDAGNGDIAINGVQVVGTDTDGDTAIGEVQVQVIDDVPSVLSCVVTNWDGEASWNNSFGYYVKDANGDPINGEGTIIWGNASNDNYGESFAIEGYTQDQIGFFIVKQGGTSGLNDGDVIDLTTAANVILGDGTGLQDANDQLIPDSAPGTRYYFEDTGDTDYSDVQVTVQWQTLGGAVLDEDDLPDGTDGTPESVVSTGLIADVFDFGADGPAASDSIAFVDPLPTSVNIGTTAVDLVLSGGVLYGQIGGTNVFSLALTDSSYTFELLGALPHAAGDGENVLTINIPGLIVATDEDGDQVSAGFTIHVVDDVPSADISATGATTIAEDAAGTLTGSWSAPLGADDAGSLTFTVGAETQTLGTAPLEFTIANAGVLTINPNGTWSLDPSLNGNNASGTSFDIKITGTDADGDKAEDTLTLTVTDGQIPTTDSGSATPAIVTVDEDGSAPAGDTITFTEGSDDIVSVGYGNAVGDTLTLSGEHGSITVKVLSISGNTMVVGDAVDGNTVTLTLSPNGDNTSVGIAAVLGTGDAFAHLTGNGENTLTIEGVTVVATDTDGDKATAHINVKVVDDVPTSLGGDNSQDVLDNASPVEVNLAAMFDGGADGIVKYLVNGVEVIGSTYSFDPSGKLGDYDFTVKAIDADGDEATNSFSFNVEASNLPPTAENTEGEGPQGTTIALVLTGADTDGTVHHFTLDPSTLNGLHGTFSTDAAGNNPITSGTSITASGGQATIYFHPSDNPGDDPGYVEGSFHYKAVDDDGAVSTAATGTITVTDVDPSAQDDHASLSEGTTGGVTNLLFILDLSYSMQGQNLADMKAAVSELVDAYEDNGGFNLKIVTFNDSGDPVAGIFTDAQSVKSWVNGLDNGDLVMDTNYQAAIQGAMNAWDAANIDGADSNNSIAYFISDGEPRSGSMSSVQSTWETYVNDHFSKAIAVGMGSNAPSDNDLKAVAHTPGGVSGDGDDEIYVATNVDELTNILVGTVTPTTTGNVIGNDASGADGWGTATLVSATYGSESHTFSSDSDSHTFDLGDAGSVKVFGNGDYQYTAGADVADDTTAAIDYVVRDGDGSTASATLYLTTEDSSEVVAYDNYAEAGLTTVEIHNVDITPAAADFENYTQGHITDWTKTNNALTADPAMWGRTSASDTVLNSDGSFKISDNNASSGNYSVVVSEQVSISSQGGEISFEVDLGGYRSGDTFSYSVYQKNSNGSWSQVSGKNGQFSDSDPHSVSITGLGEGEYRVVFTVNDETSSGGRTFNATISDFMVTTVLPAETQIVPETVSGNVIDDPNTYAAGSDPLGAVDNPGSEGATLYINGAVVSDTGTTVAGTYGTLTIWANGNYEYTPFTTSSIGDVETFTYELRQADGDSDTAVLAIKLVLGETPPVAGDDNIITNIAAETITVPAAALLANDTDANGDDLSVSQNVFDTGYVAPGADFGTGNVQTLYFWSGQTQFSIDRDQFANVNQTAAAVVVAGYLHSVSNSSDSDEDIITVSLKSGESLTLDHNLQGNWVQMYYREGDSGNWTPISDGSSFTADSDGDYQVRMVNIDDNGGSWGGEGSEYYDLTMSINYADADGSGSGPVTSGYTVSDGNGGTDDAVVTVQYEHSQTLNGTDGDDILMANDTATILNGGEGNDVLIGGAGDDTMSGGDGEDTFYFENFSGSSTTIDEGHDAILDFDVNEDTIDLNALFDELGASATVEVKATDENGNLLGDQTADASHFTVSIADHAEFSVTVETTDDATVQELAARIVTDHG